MPRGFHTTYKDYYAILGLGPEATEDEIKRTYRRLALQYHPDRNPGNRQAEEKFKEISEAYAVLIDQRKRREYDQFRTSDFHTHTGGGFRYSQEDIFRDIFHDPRISELFQELSREFRASGLRFDEEFFSRMFGSGRRGVFFGGIIFGPGGVRTFSSSRGTDEVHTPPKRSVGQKKDGLLAAIGRGVKRFLSNTLLEKDGDITPLSTNDKDSDLNFRLTLTPEEAATGTKKPIKFLRGNRSESLVVTIPPGVKTGTRLRLKGKGRVKAGQKRGDLFLHIVIS